MLGKTMSEIIFKKIFPLFIIINTLLKIKSKQFHEKINQYSFSLKKGKARENLYSKQNFFSR